MGCIVHFLLPLPFSSFLYLSLPLHFLLLLYLLLFLHCFVAFDCRLFLTARGVWLPADAGDTESRKKGLARFTIGC